MMNFVRQALVSNGATIKPVVMDEWNMWAKDSRQQVSNTSGVFAMLVIGEAIKNKYGMSARWDLMNGWDNGNDHGLFSSGDEPSVTKWSPRPSFITSIFAEIYGRPPGVFDCAGQLQYKILCLHLFGWAGKYQPRKYGCSSQTVEVTFKNFYAGNRFYWYTWEGSTDNGEFSRKVLVNGTGPAGEAGGPLNYATLSANFP